MVVMCGEVVVEEKAPTGLGSVLLLTLRLPCAGSRYGDCGWKWGGLNARREQEKSKKDKDRLQARSGFPPRTSLGRLTRAKRRRRW